MQSTLGGPGPICLPTSGHSGQGGGETKGLAVKENHPDCSRLAQYALVLGSGSHVQPDSSVPAQCAQPFNLIPHKDLSTLIYLLGS